MQCPLLSVGRWIIGKRGACSGGAESQAVVPGSAGLGWSGHAPELGPPDRSRWDSWSHQSASKEVGAGGWNAWGQGRAAQLVS
jgi:hypothetical protein